MTRTTFLRFTMRQLSQRRLTDALTFMVGRGSKKIVMRGRKIAPGKGFPSAIQLSDHLCAIVFRPFLGRRESFLAQVRNVAIPE